jgi:nitrogenase subunit NifH
MIKCIQLVNGHDIIGDIEEHGPHYIVKEPAAIHLVPQQGTSFGVGLIPFMPYSESNKIAVVKDKVVIEFEPSIEMRNNYSKLFGAGIQIANVMP